MHGQLGIPTRQRGLAICRTKLPDRHCSNALCHNVGRVISSLTPSIKPAASAPLGRGPPPIARFAVRHLYKLGVRQCCVKSSVGLNAIKGDPFFRSWSHGYTSQDRVLHIQQRDYTSRQPVRAKGPRARTSAARWPTPPTCGGSNLFDESRRSTTDSTRTTWHRIQSGLGTATIWKNP